jgi:hypothetical protein
MKMRKRIVILALIILFLTAVPFFASTSATNTNTVSPTAKVSVNVQNAIQLTLATGTGCTITAGGGTDYVMSFGNIDALAINGPTCGSKFAPTTPGVTIAAYYSDYTLTPVFAGQLVSTNTLQAYVSTTFAKANLTVVQSNSAPATIAGLTPMSTNAGAQTVVATNAVSGTTITRYIGVSVSPANAAGLTGADAATITFTLTVQ